MKKLTVLTVALTIALLLPFTISAQTTENTTTPEPIDQSALSVQTETVQVEQVNVTGVTGFEQESRKFIKALNEGGLDNVVSYLHPQGFLSQKIKAKKPDYPLISLLYKRLAFVNFFENETSSANNVISLFHGAFLLINTNKENEELSALPEEEMAVQINKLKWELVTIGIEWVKSDNVWSIKQVSLGKPQSSNTQIPEPIDPSAQTATPSPPEPIDQSALSVQTETVQVEQVNVTGVTGFEQESRKFIKALNEGGPSNTASYLHPMSPMSRMIKAKKTEPLLDRWFKSITFGKFVKSHAMSETFIVTLFEGSYLPINSKKGDELRAILEKSGEEEALKQMDALKPKSTTLSITWVKTGDKWFILKINF